MRRFLVPSVLALALAAGTASHATTTSSVVTVGNEYLPGDSQYGAEMGLGPTAGLTITHIRGNQLQFTNADLAPHSLTSTLLVSGSPRFNSGLKAPGGTGDVAGITTLPNGIYGFKCLAHAFMKGTLVVTTV